MGTKPVAGLGAVMLAGLIVMLAAGRYGPLAPYIAAVKSDKQIAAVLSATGKPAADDRLLAWIEAEAVKQYRPPVDAVVDRVWKAIPAYNGREADVKATYLKAKALGIAPEAGAAFPWVYREIPAKIELDDLPPNPIYRGNPQKPMVALMINVAWGDEHLGPMLEILRDEQVKATFFFDGTWLSKHPDMARTFADQGHEASNHAYTHPNMSQLSLERQREEIGRTERLLRAAGFSNKWFAPPSGDYDRRTVQAAKEFGLGTVLWTLDTVDWKNPSSSSVVAKVANRVEPGTLILMHPTAASKGALKGMIAAIRAKGYALGTVSETLSPERVEARL